MGNRRKYSIADARLPAFTKRFRDLVDTHGGVSKVSEITGISRPTVNFWYNGQRTPDAESLCKLSKSFGITSDYMIGLEDDPRRVPTAMNALHLSKKAVDAIRDHSALGFEDILSAFDRLVSKPDFWAMLSDVIRAKEIRGLPKTNNAATETAALEAQDVFRKAAVSNTPCKMLHGTEYADYLQFEIDKAIRNLLAEEMAYKEKTASGAGSTESGQGQNEAPAL